jgi:hypothetical protein
MPKLDANDVAREKGPAGLAVVLDESTAAAPDARPAAQGWQEVIRFEYAGTLPEFPTAALPGWLRDMVQAVAVSTQTPPGLAGMLALSVLALCGAGKFRLRVTSDWFEPLNIFGVVSLPPGCRKSAVFSTITAPLKAWERAEAERLGPEIAKAKTEYEIAEQRLQSLKARAAKTADAIERRKLTEEAQTLAAVLDGMKPPAPPRLFADDVTPEQLAHMLAEHEGRMAVLSAEGDIFEILAGRYSERENLGCFLKGHAGDALRVDRVGRAADYVDNPALTVALCVQPDVIQGLSAKPGFRGRGLLGRFLYVLPLSPLGRRQIEPPAVPLDTITAYDRNVSRLLALPWAKDAEGNNGASILKLSAEARALHRDFQAALEPMLAAGGELETLTDWAGKLAGAVARLAGCLHLAAVEVEPWNTPVSAETTAAAIKLGHYFTAHAKAAFCLMGADPALELAKRLVAWLERKGCERFSRRDACYQLRVKVRELEEPLALLTEHGFIRAAAGPALQSAQAGRKPGPAYEVNPLLFQR